MVNKKPDQRIERDAFGEVTIPAGAYWGIQTARVKELVSASGLKPHGKLVDALALIKKAAALSNAELGRLEVTRARAIGQVADEILSGQWRDQFVVDAFQWGCGQPLNTNMNEVIANRGAEIAGVQVGAYDFIDPADHVNLGQSESALFPSAMRMAVLFSSQKLEPALTDLERLLRRKSLEFERVIKVGRLHLQDSLPVTLGQEFNAYGASIERSVRKMKEASGNLIELNLGASEVGTGYGAHGSCGNLTIEKLAHFTGIKFRQAEDMLRLTQSMADFVAVSSTLKELAVELIKMGNDLCLMCSGPYAGIGEISMPVLESAGKNRTRGQGGDPILIECLIMACYQVIGNDSVISLCAQSGQFESNVMMPLIIHNLMQSLDLLRNAISPFNQKCLSGITANAEQCQKLFDQSDFFLSVLSAHIDAKTLDGLVREREAKGGNLREMIVTRQIMKGDLLDSILNYKALTRASTGGGHIDAVRDTASDAASDAVSDPVSDTTGNTAEGEGPVGSQSDKSVVTDTHKQM